MSAAAEPDQATNALTTDQPTLPDIQPSPEERRLDSLGSRQHLLTF